MKKFLLLFCGLLACLGLFAEVERVVVKDGYFYTEKSRELFVPIGANYIRLNGHPADEKTLWHCTFAPRLWNKAAAKTALEEMRAAGMNVVRVFIDPFEGRGVIENEMAKELSKAYMGNLIDFIGMAQDNGIRVIIAMTFTPNCPLTTPKKRMVREGGASGANIFYFEKDYLERKKLFLKEFTRYLKSKGRDSFNNIFAIELLNEECFSTNGRPLDGKTRRFKGPNGKNYTLKTEEDVQNMLDECTVYYLDTMVNTIKQVERDMLVTTSVFTFAAVQKAGPFTALASAANPEIKDDRYPFRPMAMLDSKISYLDIHFYIYSSGADFTKNIASIEYKELEEKAKKMGKPIIIGEIGIHKGWAANTEQVENWFKSVFNAVSSTGMFQGFLWWTWDCFEQKDWIEVKDPKTNALKIIEGYIQSFKNRVELENKNGQ